MQPTAKLSAVKDQFTPSRGVADHPAWVPLEAINLTDVWNVAIGFQERRGGTSVTVEDVHQAMQSLGVRVRL